MAKTDHLNRYAEGWIKGDAGIIVSSLDDKYELDDPNAGKISKQAFSEYMASFWQQVEAIRGKVDQPLLEVSELLTQEVEGTLTAWVWWLVPGTDIQGSGLIKVGDRGVLSERLAFYTKLAGG